ncbi:MAG TPA: putative lipid II flippase FtsW [Limnochordia bacterium]|nr:putative lipid II flippase FtsW [Limnochordia bacterium]
MTAGRRKPDLILFAATVGLLVIGVVMVFSASYTTGLADFNDPYHYIKRQAMWAVIGVVAMVFVTRIDYRKFRAFALPGLIAAMALLALVLVVGNEVAGAKRWFDFGPVGLQPSELAKLAVINFTAGYIATMRGRIRTLWQGLLLPLGIVAIVFLLILLEPDFGTGVAVIGTATLMLFAGGTNLLYLALLGLSGLPVLGVLVWTKPYRMQRIVSFLDPWKDPLGAGWNVIQSLYAIGSGGLFGLGLGESRQKFAYLPEQHTDFIFAILSEELGFIGVCAVILCFLVLAWRGYRVALKAPDLYGSMLAVGITTMIVLQAILNIGVVSGSFPVTGVTLPLISFGGSSLTITLAGLGVLLNISRAAR